MATYSSKISSDMTIDKKSGEVKLNGMRINVDGYTEPKTIEKGVADHNSGKESYAPKESAANYSSWPKGTWHELYSKMMGNMASWKKTRRKRYQL